MGSFWLGWAVTALVLVIPVIAITGLVWEETLKVALLSAVFGYPVSFGVVAAGKVLDIYRHGHPHFRTQIDAVDGGVTAWLMLKDGSPPQAVNELAVVVRRRGETGHGVTFPGVMGSRTIDHTGAMPPHVLYPDQIPGAPPIRAGMYDLIWSDVRRGKRRDFLWHSEKLD
jgi:hypothetical protein